MKLSGKTKITGLFGYPVEHTLSPAMHNAAFDELGIDYCYVAFPVHPDSLKDAVRSIRALNLSGVNITIPHKEKVIPFLDKVDEEASFIGAVNTIVNSQGKLVGYNTDGRGFIQSLSESGISLEGKIVLVLGAGGASRAISYYLCQKAVELIVCDIDRGKTENLIQDLKKIRDNISSVDTIVNAERYDIIINATPLGLKNEDPLPLHTSLLNPNQTVCDLIYKKTQLLQDASQKGCTTLNGLGMLLWQGAFAFELWTGKKPPVDVMRKALFSIIK
ncbi:MAG: shikimate dehydrogenase [Nitrospirota bacterium]|nr:shikimate dehydrogenase [Nitrospirota bacterium]MDH5768412.1 shikimate dehydrogenase [Nitrospirota bacterium]